MGVVHMREIDPDTWIMLAFTWLHGLLVGYAIWHESKSKCTTEDEET